MQLLQRAIRIAPNDYILRFNLALAQEEHALMTLAKERRGLKAVERAVAFLRQVCLPSDWSLHVSCLEALFLRITLGVPLPLPLLLVLSLPLLISRVPLHRVAAGRRRRPTWCSKD